MPIDMNDFERVLIELFRSGADTYEIACRMGIPEYQVERTLHIGLDRARGKDAPE